MKRFTAMIPVIGLLFALSASHAWADHVAFASGTGSQAGGVETDGTCQLYLELVPMTAVKYKLQCFNITGVTQAHVHAGGAQEGGGVLASLFGPVEATGEIDGVLSEGMIEGSDIAMEGVDLGAFMDMILSDQTYLSVHTSANPPGEVRGQVTGRVNDNLVVSASYTATATGSQEIAGDPPNLDGVTTDATCFASFRVTGLSDDGLKYKLKCWNITGVTQAHIHMGKASENGPNVAFLFDGREAQTGDVNGLLRAADRASVSKGTLRSEDLLGELSGEPISALAEQLRNDNAYINVHTEANGPGEVRGQISFVDAIGF